MTNVMSVPTEYSSPSIRNLTRPIKTRESSPSHEIHGKDLEALSFAIEHGDRETKAAAEMLAYHLLCEAITARLLDADRGPIPRLFEQIRDSVRLFGEVLR